MKMKHASVMYITPVSDLWTLRRALSQRLRPGFRRSSPPSAKTSVWRGFSRPLGKAKGGQRGGGNGGAGDAGFNLGGIQPEWPFHLAGDGAHARMFARASVSGEAL